ncbi:shikimate dehydrogenase [Clostridium sp. cel8]|jgi:shikimate dehydrogenase|uniref:shikimate dehydrogenase n=1 Tax=unclassified Clostridium TaxID=2614128 RepID=UPI0015F35A53|nr:shikimate dehydrogenase [Clostridium sp. cel8]MBA5851017.1 shikimate dehydrogenase [Clostridium sp. cel8]
MSNFYGLLGEKLGHSFSPIINSLVLKRIGLSGTYNLFEVKKDNLQQSLNALKILECKGLNVTIPYKIEIMKYLDDVSKEAKNIGAVNTIKFSQDRLKGYNTDYYGFGMTLEKYNIEVKNKHIVILGTGGASRAVERYVVDNGVGNITYVSRNPKENFRNDFNVISYEELNELKDVDIIINCTPCGMYPNVDKSPVKKEILNKFNAAVDLIYNPENTLFLKMGKELGLKTVNGMYMLIAQNLASQKIWHDMDIDIKVVDDVYDEILKSIRSKM